MARQITASNLLRGHTSVTNPAINTGRAAVYTCLSLYAMPPMGEWLTGDRRLAPPIITLPTLSVAGAGYNYRSTEWVFGHQQCSKRSPRFCIIPTTHKDTSMASVVIRLIRNEPRRPFPMYHCSSLYMQLKKKKKTSNSAKDSKTPTASFVQNLFEKHFYSDCSVNKNT